MTRGRGDGDGRASLRDITFPGALGQPIAAVMELPAGRPRAVALMAHCFTCSSSSHATARISGALAERGYAVLRFDFTGLGQSGGDFADTTFTTNIEDLLAAAQWLRGTYGAPRLLVGHSLGGAAVIAAAGSMPSVRGVVTIGAPACPDHVLHLFAEPVDSGADRIRVDIGGRPFDVGRAFLDDIAQQPQLERLARLIRPLLVLHSPVDTIVGIDNARRVFDAARHPKSFVALDGADHLLSRREDAAFAADIIAAWAARHVPPEIPEVESLVEGPAEGEVVVEEAAPPGYSHTARTARHTWMLDEPVSVGGTDQGPNPYDMLLAALGGCTSMTMRMYAARKGWDYGATGVTLRHSRVHALDCAECESAEGMVDRIEREIHLDPALDPDQREALLRIADRCPVHRTLTGEVTIVTTLAE
ncbi:MAG: alpha/beta fold hydrolase [Dermatophilaceae bacterium]